MLNIEWSLFHCAMLILCDRCFGGGGRRGGGGRLTPAPDLEMTQCPICNARAGKHYCLVCPNVYATVEEVLAHQRARAHMGGHLAAVDGDPSRSARRQTVLAKARARRQNDDDDDDDDDGGNHGTTRGKGARKTSCRKQLASGDFLDDDELAIAPPLFEDDDEGDCDDGSSLRDDEGDNDVRCADAALAATRRDASKRASSGDENPAKRRSLFASTPSATTPAATSQSASTSATTSATVVAVPTPSTTPGVDAASTTPTRITPIVWPPCNEKDFELVTRAAYLQPQDDGIVYYCDSSGKHIFFTCDRRCCKDKIHIQSGGKVRKNVCVPNGLLMTLC